MSDVTMFPIHEHLRHHLLEALAVQWDGSKDQAAEITREIVAEMQMRDADVIRAHARALNSTVDGASVEFEMVIQRRADGEQWRVVMAPKRWLVIWLHEQRVHEVELIDAERGEWLFRPIRPVITLQPRPRGLDGG